MCDYHNQWNDISLCEKCWIFRITRLCTLTWYILGRVEQTVAGLIWRQRPLYKLFMIIQDTMIKQEISALFRELVKEVNGIYKTSDFAGQEGFQLRVDRLAVSFLSYLYLSLMFRIRRVAAEHLRTTVFHCSLQLTVIWCLFAQDSSILWSYLPSFFRSFSYSATIYAHTSFLNFIFKQYG